MHFALIFTGLGLMLTASFFDSVRGPLLPLLGHELGLSYEAVSWFLVVGYVSAVAFGRTLIPLVDSWGVRRLAATLCLLGPVVALAARGVSGFASLLVLGALIGCLSSAVGAVANLFILEGTSLRHRGRIYAFLHTMYGLGSQAAPLVLGIALTRGLNWRSLFAIACVPLLAMAAWVVWGLGPPKKEEHLERPKPAPFRFRSIQGLLVCCFAVYVGAEVMTSMWMVAYLVEVDRMTVAQGSFYATGFFLCMTLSRFACMLVEKDSTERVVILLGIVAALMSLAGAWTDARWPLMTAGLVGPFFPLILARLTRYFPAEAPSLTFRVLLGGQATVAVSHLGVGWLATHTSVRIAYTVPFVGFVLVAILTTAYFIQEKRHFHPPVIARR